MGRGIRKTGGTTTEKKSWGVNGSERQWVCYMLPPAPVNNASANKIPCEWKHSEGQCVDFMPPPFVNVAAGRIYPLNKGGKWG